MKTLALSLALIVCGAAAAADAEKPVVKTVNGRVAKVDVEHKLLSVSIKGEKGLVFAITPETKISALNGGKLLKDLAAGDFVVVQYVEGENLRAVSIRALPVMGK